MGTISQKKGKDEKNTSSGSGEESGGGESGAAAAEPEQGTTDDDSAAQTRERAEAEGDSSNDNASKPFNGGQEQEEEYDDDVHLDTEFLTDDFVNIGMRDALSSQQELEGNEGGSCCAEDGASLMRRLVVSQSDSKCVRAGDIDFKALESMVEEIENDSELP